jgi:hypothetical protein
LILIKRFWILEQSSPKSCELIKKYHEDIFFPPKKFSRVDPSINEPLKQYIDLGLIRLCSRVLAATMILKPRSTLLLERSSNPSSFLFVANGKVVVATRQVDVPILAPHHVPPCIGCALPEAMGWACGEYSATLMVVLRDMSFAHTTFHAASNCC